MALKPMAGLALTALALAACGGQAPEPENLAGLPKSAEERAELCGRAATAFAASGASQEAGEGEIARRRELLQSVVDATGFFEATGLDAEEGQARLGDIEATLLSADWLDTLNTCKAVYDLGPPEPVPPLPEARADRAAACGAAVFLANNEGASPELLANMATDPQSAYFLTVAAAATGQSMSEAGEVLQTQVQSVMESGAVGSYKTQCESDFPQSIAGREVTLPANQEEAIVACAFAAGVLEGGGDLSQKRATALQARLAKVDKPLPENRADELAENLLAQIETLGTPPDIAKACEARFPE